MSDGKVNFPGAFGQQLLFEGCRWGNCTPSDIDACIEFDGRLFLFIEVKQWGMEPPVGQRLMLEHIVQATLQKPGVSAFALLAWHNTPAPEPIRLEDCIVASYYHGVGDWQDTKRKNNVRYHVDRAYKIRIRNE